MNLLALVVGYIFAKMVDAMRQPGATPTPSPNPPGYDPLSRAPGPIPYRPANGAKRKSSSTMTSQRPTEQTVFTPPWPQVVPSGLPSFPGAGWEVDNPPPPPVVARAQELLTPLWGSGEGTFKVEKTANRWIVYRATRMGEKKGVVAYRESAHAEFLTPPGPVVEPTPTPDVSTLTPTPDYLQTSASSPVALPTLRMGSSGPDVATLQKMLNTHGASLTPDGKFGPQTRGAVIAYQGMNGLAADGVVGPKTWGKLMGGTSA